MGGDKQERTGSNNVYGKSGLHLESNMLHAAPPKAPILVPRCKMENNKLHTALHAGDIYSRSTRQLCVKHIFKSV